MKYSILAAMFCFFITSYASADLQRVDDFNCVDEVGLYDLHTLENSRMGFNPLNISPLLTTQAADCDILTGDCIGTNPNPLLTLNLMGQYWRQSVTPCTNGDVNCDGVVGLLDLDKLGKEWGHTTPVPEPTTMTLFLLAMGVWGRAMCRPRK